MITVNLFLMVMALVLAIIATVKIPEPPHLSYGWAAVVCVILSMLFR